MMVISVTFVDHQGESRTVPVRPGGNLMEAARRGDIPGIVAECGGARACATCRVLVDPEWLERVGPPATGEAELLELSGNLQDDARLACQIILDPVLDGLIVRTPQRQY